MLWTRHYSLMPGELQVNQGIVGWRLIMYVTLLLSFTFIVHLLSYFEIVYNLFNCISQLYIPLNIVDWHWVLARVDIRNRHVDIYDSLLNAGTNRQEFEAIWVMMPYILRDSNVYDTRPSLDRSLKKFAHKYITSLPQQNNGYVYRLFSYLF